MPYHTQQSSMQTGSPKAQAMPKGRHNSSAGRLQCGTQPGGCEWLSRQSRLVPGGPHTWMLEAVGQSPLSRAAHSCSSRCVTLSDTSLHRTATAASSTTWHSERRQEGGVDLASARQKHELASHEKQRIKGGADCHDTSSSSHRRSHFPGATRAAPGCCKVSQ